MLMMARREILPAVIRYTGEMAEAWNRVSAFGLNRPHSAADELLEKLNAGCGRLGDGIIALAAAMEHIPQEEDPLCRARYMKDSVLPAMRELRDAADSLETITDRKAWPFPTYDELLFNI